MYKHYNLMSTISNILNIIHRKRNNNIIKLRLGKKNLNNDISLKIDLRKFEDILNKLKKLNNHSSISYKNYNKYYDSNKIYIIDNNGWLIVDFSYNMHYLCIAVINSPLINNN